MNCPICKSLLEIIVKNERETWYRCASCNTNNTFFIASYYLNGSCRHYYMKIGDDVLFGGKETGYTIFRLHGGNEDLIKIDFTPFFLEELGDKLSDLFESIKFYL